MSTLSPRSRPVWWQPESQERLLLMSVDLVSGWFLVQQPGLARSCRYPLCVHPKVFKFFLSRLDLSSAFICWEGHRRLSLFFKWINDCSDTQHFSFLFFFKFPMWMNPRDMKELDQVHTANQWIVGCVKSWHWQYPSLKPCGVGSSIIIPFAPVKRSMLHRQGKHIISMPSFLLFWPFPWSSCFKREKQLKQIQQIFIKHLPHVNPCANMHARASKTQQHSRWYEELTRWSGDKAKPQVLVCAST